MQCAPKTRFRRRRQPRFSIIISYRLGLGLRVCCVVDIDRATTFFYMVKQLSVVFELVMIALLEQLVQAEFAYNGTYRHYNSLPESNAWEAFFGTRVFIG